MELKETLKDSRKYLPHAIVSLSAGASLLYLLTSILSGTYNPLNWSENIRQREREIQEYNAVVNQVTKCVDRDRIPGFSVNEINELYQRAGIDFEAPPQSDFEANFWKGAFYRPREQEIRGPPLTKNDLERVALSCQ